MSPLTSSTASKPSWLRTDGSLVGTDGSRVDCGEYKAPPAKAGGQIIEDEDTNETVEQIVAWLDERKLI